MGEARELKRSVVFVFDDGQLRIKLEGYGVANGWGEFAFIEVPPSELIALRDFLNRTLPSFSNGENHDKA